MLFSSCQKKDSYSKVIVIQYEFNDTIGKGDTIEIGYLTNTGDFTKRIFRFGTSENGFEKTYIYDSKGKQISLISNFNNTHIYRTDRTLDSFGSDVENKTYNLGKTGDTTTRIYVNKYNADSSVVISSVFYKGSNTVNETDESLYDSNKRLIQRIIAEPMHNNKIVSIEKYKYNQNGKNTSAVIQNIPDSFTTEGIYSYDPEGKLIKESHLKNGKMEYEITYVYKYGRKSEGKKITSDNKKYLLKIFYQ